MPNLQRFGNGESPVASAKLNLIVDSLTWCSGEYKIVRPDFIFFATQDNGKVVADIVDPHGLHLADALPKLQGLTLYAEAHPKAYRRIRRCRVDSARR